MENKAEELITYCQANGRICPMPMKWDELFQMLQNGRQRGESWEPPPPLILAAWHFSSKSDKQLRLREHIVWAEKHGMLKKIDNFLRNLREKDWLHDRE